MDKKIKVAFLGSLSEPDKIRGGAERHIFNLTNQLADNPYIDLHIIFCTKTPVDNTKFNANITLHQLFSPQLPKTITGISVDCFNLVKEVKKLNPDIVHAQMIGAPYGNAAAKLSMYYPTILTIHTMTFQLETKSRNLKQKIHDSIWKILESREAKRIHSFIIIASNLKNELSNLGAKNINIIPTSIEKKWFTVKYPTVDNRLLCVGRFEKIKGQDILLGAIKILKEKGLNVKLHLIGAPFDKQYFTNLKKIVINEKLSDQVRLLENVNDDTLLKEYNECSLFILPSREETQPVVLFEAMASGKPIVATRVGSVPEMITDGQEGFLVNYGKPKELAEKIAEILSNKELRERMGESSRNKVKNMTWKQIAQQTFQLYHETIKDFQIKKEKK